MASKSKRERRANVCTRLRRHRAQRTVLGIAVPLLAGHIDAMNRREEFAGLTEKQIEKGFRELLGKFIRSDYHSTYLARRLGPRGFLEPIDGRYVIRPELMENVSVGELKELHDELVASLREAYEERQAAMARLEETCRLPDDRIEERRALVDEYLNRLSGNRGEMFEVVSFAVLREYFRTFGFSLQRFSTTHANDGGMDFVGGDAIYQVTTDESPQKVRTDLSKSPGTKRVLVRPSVTQEIIDLCDNEVLEAIDLRDLLDHFIGWLLSRDSRSKRARHLQQVLLIALEEFQRENKADTA